MISMLKMFCVWGKNHLGQTVCSLAVILLVGGTAFAQSPPGSPEAWYSGSTIVEADATEVPVWVDSSGNNHDARKDSDGFGFAFTGPDAGTGAVLGDPNARYLSFDGGIDQLGLSLDGTAASQWKPAQGSYTIFALARGASDGDRRGVLVAHDINGNNTGDFAFGFGDLNGHPASPNYPGELDLMTPNVSPLAFPGEENTHSGNNIAPGDTDDTWHVFATTVEALGTGLGANVALYIDGAQVASRAVHQDGIFGSRGDNPPTIGNSFIGGGENALTADIAEILIYSGALSAGDRTAVEGWIGAAYVPEPGTLTMLLLGLSSFFAIRRRKG